MISKYTRQSKGFTLIELLVVMGIIGLLSAVSLFALQGSRGSGRDARRKADLQQIASGLELFKSDCGGYASNLPTAGNQLTGVAARGCGKPNSVTYIQALPDDPDSSNNYVYQSLPSLCTTNCVQFRVWAALEVQPTPGPSTYLSCGTAPSCGGSVTCNYCVTNP